MKYVQILAACDMTKAETGQTEPAAETVCIALGPDPGHLRVRELDLSEEWAKELREFLAPYLAAGHEPGELVTPGQGSSAGSLSESRKQAAREQHDFRQSQAAWAKANGYKITKRKAGGWYFPVKTQEAYRQHLAGRDDLLTGDLAPDEPR